MSDLFRNLEGFVASLLILGSKGDSQIGQILVCSTIVSVENSHNHLFFHWFYMFTIVAKPHSTKFRCRP